MIKVKDIPTPSYAELKALPRDIGFVPAVNPSPTMLSPEQIEFYNREGYLMPFDGLSDDEVRDLRNYFDGVLDAFMELGHDSYSISTAHLRFGRLYDLMFHPAILGPVKDLLGEDVVAWGSHFFCKLPNDGKRVAWHQDNIYWPLSPSRTVAVWLAIDDVDPENANMRFIPKSHVHGPIGIRESMSEADVLGLVVDTPEDYGDPAVDVTLKAGQLAISPCTAVRPTPQTDAAVGSPSAMPPPR